ncbi:MAG TPA: thiamine-phosphate kinase [Planctomycetota bacterium]|nr:thiamine-phosphate kinase [Planctomycetota bacterium]
MGFSESSLIAFLKAHARQHAAVVVGIGHDAAVVRSAAGEGLVLKSDQTIEGVHFRREEAPIGRFGRKALARVLSDLGAIGARPIACLCSAALPDDLDEASAQALFMGLLELAHGEGTSLVGGDLSRSPQGIVLDVAGLGFLDGRAPMLRTGAQVGDALVVTGPLGGSRHGHHLRFQPRWREGVALAASGAVHACIDLSDGLARDLHHVTTASNVGARVESARLPRRSLPDGGQATATQALHDGEDFELLFAAPAAALASLAALPALGDVTLTRIGTVVPVADGVALVDAAGTAAPLPVGGFEHRFGTGLS